MPGMDTTAASGRVPAGSEASDINRYQTEFSALSTSLTSLFEGLSFKAAEAGEKESQLQRELALWRDSYMRAEKKSSDLEQQISGLRSQAIPNASIGPEFAIVLLDGDGLIFSAALLSQGAEGGRLAAQSLRERVMQALGASQLANADIIVNVYMNKQGLGATLVKTGKLTWQTFDKFFVPFAFFRILLHFNVHIVEGFVTSHELNAIIDCGRGKEATDAKVRANLRLYADVLQCKLILLGASHDNGYSPILHSLTAESKIDKILILKGYDVLAQELKTFKNRVIDIPGLFMSEKIPTFHPAFLNTSASKSSSFGPPDAPPSPDKEAAADDIVLYASAPQMARSIARPKSSASPELAELAEPPVSQSGKSSEGSTGSSNSEPVPERKKKKKKRVPGSVSKLKPRPCHGYYLLGRHCDSSCEWGHDYDLSAEQLAELRSFVKRMPCPFWLKDKCVHQSTCIYGHECQLGDDNCPFGPSCRFLKWHKEQGRR